MNLLLEFYKTNDSTNYLYKMKAIKYIRPEVPEKAIDLCLDMFDKKEAKKRICEWINNTLDDVERQINIERNIDSEKFCKSWKDFIENN